MKKGLFAILLISLILAGCVPSLNPLYTDKDLILLPGLEDTWIDQDGNLWKFEKAEDNSYRMTYSRETGTGIKENNGIFAAHLVYLKNDVFMDLYPKDQAFRDDRGLMPIHYVATHTISKLRLNGDNLQINMLNPEWIRQMKDQKLLFIRYEMVEDGILLTAQPKDLQRFIGSYADDSKAFEKPAWQLTRYIEKPSISTTTTTISADTVKMSIDTSTTAISISTTTTAIIPVIGENAGTKGCITLYLTPLTIRVGPKERFQVNVVMDNPMGIDVNRFGLWIQYNPKAVIFKSASSFESGTQMFANWALETSYTRLAKGELYFQLRADKETTPLSGLIGQLEFLSTGKVSVSQVQFRFNRWESFPSTFMTYNHKDVLGKEYDHNDGTISAMVRVLR